MDVFFGSLSCTALWKGGTHIVFIEHIVIEPDNGIVETGLIF